MTTKLLPSQEYLLDCFEQIGSYLIWLERPIEHFHSYAKWEAFKIRFAGEIAGKTPTIKGYLRVRLNNKMYMVHRIIYKMNTGTEPNVIDHINGIKHDNRFENLRSGTHRDNARNTILCKNNKSGHPNIYDTPYGWKVSDRINGKQIHVGTYPTLEEAIEAKKRWDEA